MYVILFLLLALIVFVGSYFFLIANMDMQAIRFTPISDPITNPLMGWAPWATIKTSSQPHTLVYMDLTWRELEPVEGVYDFVDFENKQQMARWRAEGKRVVFRFVLDKPGSDPHTDIPDWLFDKIRGDGEFYDNEYGMGFTPNYANPLLLMHHQLAIDALGERYGKDDFIAFVELGSLGHWGEWHTHPGLEQLPSAVIRDQYVMQYAKAFPKTYLLMRRPFAIAQKLELGLYNDMTADYSATTEWLDWIAHGGDYLPEEPGSLLPMVDAWKKSPVGGEQTPSLSNDQIYGIDLEQTLQLLQKSHTTFIGPGSPYKVDPADPLQSGLDRVIAAIGYRVYLDQVRMPRLVRYGNTINVTFAFSNDGVAPIYYNWPTHVFIFNENGDVVGEYPLDIDLRTILPMQRSEADVIIPVNSFQDGSFSVGIAILDPLTGHPAIKFANKNARQDLIQYVGSFDINWLLDFSIRK